MCGWRGGRQSWGDFSEDFGHRPSGTNRVNRGGSWNNTAENCRSANRNNNDPGNRNNNVGFRLALSSRPIRKDRRTEPAGVRLPRRRGTNPPAGRPVPVGFGRSRSRTLRAASRLTRFLACRATAPRRHVGPDGMWSRKRGVAASWRETMPKPPSRSSRLRVNPSDGLESNGRHLRSHASLSHAGSWRGFP
ncbi:MAG: SUMF1/EgtB/PvdO family nonheme iron enzyme [Pseudomonadota bacterium]